MTTIRQVSYAPTAAPLASVEVMSFRRLRTLNRGETLRADFCVVGIVESGTGSVSIDFTTHAMSQRTCVWIPPGSVHRWVDISAAEGPLILFLPTTPVTSATRARVVSTDEGTVWDFGGASWPLLLQAVRHLQGETREVQRPTGSGPLEVGIPELLVSALIARLRLPDAPARLDNPIFQNFRALLDQHVRRHHDAGFYARSLGYDPRTLSRATQRAVGVTAKAYIAERIALQAKRLLAHDGFSAARVAGELGFSSPSSFSIFFHKTIGERPGTWQRQQSTQPNS